VSVSAPNHTEQRNTLLLQAFRSLLAARDLTSVAAIVSHAARQITGADGACVVLREGDACYYIDEEAIAPLWKGSRFPAEMCVSGMAMREQRVIAIPDITSDPRIPLELYRPTFVTSVLLAPGGDPAVGAVGAYWQDVHTADQGEIDALSTLADGMAVAVTNLRIQSRLAELEARFRTMADSTPVMIWVHDADGKLEFVNRSWLQFFGTTEEQARDDKWQPLVHPDDRNTYVSAFLQALKSGTPYEAEARVRRPDGEWRWIASYGAPRFDQHGQCVGMVGSSVDITELRLAWVRAEEQSRRKEQWLSIVGHELRQPVHAIKGALRLLQVDVPPASQERARNVLERQVAQMGRILDDLLDTARIVRGEVALDRQLFDLREVLAEAVDAVASDYEGRQQTVSVAVPNEPVLVRVDANRLQQVIGNLLSNASKFSNIGDRVVAGIRFADDGYAELFVSDVGQGIDKSTLPRIFDLFFSAGGNAVSSFGVGLAVARKLMELHGGTLGAFSEGPGLGSQFVVRLPLAAEGELA
jgi:PAS domain S-box-containing protein